MLSLFGFALWYLGVFNLPIKEQVNRFADELVEKAADYKRQIDPNYHQSKSENPTSFLSSPAAPYVHRFVRQTSAEVAGCNDESVKQVVMTNTFEKDRSIALEQWKKRLGEPFIQRVTPYVCPPFRDPSHNFDASPNNAPLGHGTEIKSPTGQVMGRTVVPLTPEEYLEAHKRNCAAPTTIRPEQATRNEIQYNHDHENISRNIALVESVEAAIINVRQREYDASNNIRYCVAEFKYQNLSIELRQALGDSVVYPNGKGYSCGKSFTYKIEALLDRPESFFVSWDCLPVNRDLQ